MTPSAPPVDRCVVPGAGCRRRSWQLSLRCRPRPVRSQVEAHAHCGGGNAGPLVYHLPLGVEHAKGEAFGRSSFTLTLQRQLADVEATLARIERRNEAGTVAALSLLALLGSPLVRGRLSSVQ